MRARHWVALGPGGLDDFAIVDAAVPAPQAGEVTIEVIASGVNPADLKHPRSAAQFPLPVGYEVSGRLVAIGENTELASGPAAVGDDVLAFRVSGGYATALTVPAEKVFAKPRSLGFDEAAGLLLAGCTAADMLRASRATRGELIVVHGASGAVGIAILQLARIGGLTVIGTCGSHSAPRVRDHGGAPVDYGPGVGERIRTAAQGAPVAAALDTVGTDEALDTSLKLVDDRSRIVTIAAPARAARDGLLALGGRQPESVAFRDSIRSTVIQFAGDGDLEVEIAARFAFDDARAALRLVAEGHAGGKVVIRP